MFFFTVHDEAGNRIDDESDFPMTWEQMVTHLENYNEIEIAGTMGKRFFRDGQLILSYQEVV